MLFYGCWTQPSNTCSPFLIPICSLRALFTVSFIVHCVFMVIKPLLECVPPANPTYDIELASVWTKSLYPTCEDKHFPLLGHCSGFQLWHSFGLSEMRVFDVILQLWSDYSWHVCHAAITYVGIIFVKLCNLWFDGKCLPSSFKKLPSMLDLTFLLNSVLNHMIFCFLLFFLVLCVIVTLFFLNFT